jgi:hypothetical protein
VIRPQLVRLMEVTMREPKPGAAERSTILFLGLAAVALTGIIVWRMAEWRRIGAALGVKDRIQIEADALKTVAQILGGGALLAGLYFAWKNVQMLQEGQITERFTRSIEQLGSDRLEVRLGGIYALGRLARECRRDQHSISQVLCAYVRDRARWSEGRTGDHPTIDIQAVLTLLGRQRWARDPVRPWLDLSGTDLRGADLCWAHLEAANFIGCHLEGARLVDAHLEGAYMTDAHVNGADFTGTSLDRADLCGVIGLTEEQICAARTTAATRLPKCLQEADGSE